MDEAEKLVVQSAHHLDLPHRCLESTRTWQRFVNLWLDSRDKIPQKIIRGHRAPVNFSFEDPRGPGGILLSPAWGDFCRFLVFSGMLSPSDP
jgi:hypothetical protein